MSRIGKKPVVLPEGVTATIENHLVTISGPKGSLAKQFPNVINLELENKEIVVTRNNDEKISRQLHGTVRALINGMVEGVSKGFEKRLVINGIGYKASLDGTNLILNVGYSHQVIVKPLPGVKITVASPTEVVVNGYDKQAVGQIAAEIREARKPEPYLGKGIAYKGERIRRKEGKKAGKK